MASDETAGVPPGPALDAASERLVAGLRRGDESAYLALVETHGSALLRCAQRHVRSRAVAEDVVQDTWLAVHQGIARFEGRSSLRTWLFRILLYRAISHGERERRVVPLSALDGPRAGDGGDRAPEALEDLGGAPLLHALPVSPEDRVLAREARVRVEAAIAGLPSRQQRVIVLRDVEGWAAEEVCGALGLTPGNQRVLLHRARAAVRSTLGGDFAEA